MKSGFSSKRGSGFTLLELLIVIAVLGLLAGIVLIAINPVEQLARTRDSNKKSDITSLAKAIEAYAVLNSKYPNATSTWGTTLINSGELKNLPTNNDPTVCANGFNQNGYCYKKDNNSGEAIIYTSLVSTLDISQCDSDQKTFYAYSTKEGKASIVCTIGLTSEPNPDGSNFHDAALNFKNGNLPTVRTFSRKIEELLSNSQVGKWSFEDGANSTVFKDSSGNNNNGSCASTTCPIWQTQEQCRLGFGGCLKFDASGANGQHVNFGDQDVFSFKDTVFTFSFWMKADDTTSPIGILGKRGHNNYEYSIHGNSGSIKCYTWTASGSQVYDEIGASYDTNWNHFVCTSDGTKIRFYKNGALVSGPNGKRDNNNNMENASGSFEIGRAGDASATSHMKGLIDEVAIYTKAFTAYQIQHLYAQGLLRHQLAKR